MIFTDQYGQRWPRRPDDLTIEFHQIKLVWKKHLAGTDQGDNLLEHYLKARKLIWPDRYCHRWTELIYEQIIKNAVTIVMGSASSQKTAHITEWNLLDYWVYPNETAVMVTSTTRDKLEDAVWGEYKKLWKEGKKRFPWLAGQMIDFKQRIATDERGRDSEDARDLRRGIFCKSLFQGHAYIGLGSFAGVKQKRMRLQCDELQFCFLGTENVMTESGNKPISKVAIGEKVLGAAGWSPVLNTFCSRATVLVRLKTTDGRTLTCTPGHRFFTSKGWKKAFDLSAGQYMLSTNEALSLLWNPIRAETVTAGVRQLHCSPNSKVSDLRKDVFGFKASRPEAFLRAELCREMDYQPAGDSSENIHAREVGEGDGNEKNMAGERSGRRMARATVETDEREPSDAQPGNLSQGGGFNSGGRLPSPGAGRKWNRANESGVAVIEDVPGSEVELRGAHFSEEEFRISRLLQVGRGVPVVEVGYRGGRIFTQQSDSPSKGHEENGLLGGTWVESITILQQGDSGFPETGPDHKGCRVYNLEVSHHPSYTVSGLLVHNCAPTFLDCLPNLRSNTGFGGFKVIGSGNPKHDPNDQLGMVAEPLEGWAAKEGIEKTEVWPIRLSGGVCVNLIGTDSPNFDQPEDKYPGLIGHAFERIIAHDYGVNSHQYETQVRGRMRIGLEHSRVITRQICRLHNAHDKAVWGGKPRTRIYAVDPAYGGGDRCVAGWGEFGESIEGSQILRLNPPKVLKIIIDPKKTPEDQIAEQVKADLDQYQIPAENCFYDSFGKGTIGYAFARVFGVNPPVPVDAGARPTKRPVRYDLFVTDPDGRRRLKRCDEHYDRFVSELWFSVRETIESGQMRELQEDVMLEGCWREYSTVSGNRTAIETKEDLKERIGKSPDLFDHCAILCEGARQRGFKIERIGADVAADDSSSWNWFFERQKKSAEFRRSHALTF